MKVSVLMTCFEHERFVARALDGVLEQEGVEFELLVGDDASTDGSRAVIADYARAHPDRVRPFFPEANLGKGGKAIFAELVARARGRYVAMLDADDYWTAPDKLVRQVAHLEAHPDCSMCFHDVLCTYDDGSLPDERYNGADQPSRVSVSALLDRCVVASCSPVFRQAAIDPLPAWYFELPWGDWPLYFMAAQRGALHYLPDVMGVYRIHAAGMYRGLSRLEALENRTAFYEGLRVPAGHEGELRVKLAESWVKRALEHNRVGQRAQALRCLATAVRAWPPLALKAPGALLRRARGTAETIPTVRR
jgi:glycosyltransferase involved in cell wall biosynthesis